jgi:hypothetical protein
VLAVRGRTGATEAQAEAALAQAGGDVDAAVQSLQSFAAPRSAMSRPSGGGRVVGLGDLPRDDSGPEQRYHVGGGKSFLQVVDPQQDAGAGGYAERVLRAAQRDAADREDAAGPDSKRLLTLWHDGFSVDDGPLRSPSSPRGMRFLAAIERGQIPDELMADGGDGEVDLALIDRRSENYVAPPPRPMRPFSGVGQSLASATAPPAASAARPRAAPAVDASRPVVSVQVRLADGARVVIQLNDSHTVGDLYAAVAAAMPPAAAAVPFVLATAFPTAVLSDRSPTIAVAGLRNAAVVVRPA